KGLDELAAFAAQFRAKGLAWLKVEGEALTGPVAKFFPASWQAELRQRMTAEVGDLLLMVADAEDVGWAALGALRSRLGAELKLYTTPWERQAAELEQAKKERRAPAAFQAKAEDFKLAWMLDFPSFIWDDEEKRWAANHHPFTAPRDEDLHLL